MGRTKSRSGDGFRERAALLDHMQNRNRLRVFEELREGEVKFSNLAETLGVTATALSQQLMKLRRDNLVTTRREGTNIYYSCSSREVFAVLDLLTDFFGARCLSRDIDDQPIVVELQRPRYVGNRSIAAHPCPANTRRLIFR